MGGEEREGTDFDRKQGWKLREVVNSTRCNVCASNGELTLPTSMLTCLETPSASEGSRVRGGGGKTWGWGEGGGEGVVDGGKARNKVIFHAQSCSRTQPFANGFVLILCSL